MTREQKREALKERIAAAQARLGERPPEKIAADAADAAVSFAKQNPILVIGGVAVLGLAIGGISRRGRRAAAKGGMLSRIATDAAIGFALAMYEKANASRNEVHLAKGQDLIGQDSQQD